MSISGGYDPSDGSMPTFAMPHIPENVCWAAIPKSCIALAKSSLTLVITVLTVKGLSSKAPSLPASALQILDRSPQSHRVVLELP